MFAKKGDLMDDDVFVCVFLFFLSTVHPLPFIKHLFDVEESERYIYPSPFLIPKATVCTMLLAILL